MRTRLALVILLLLLISPVALCAQSTQTQSSAATGVLAATAVVICGAILANLYMVNVLHAKRTGIAGRWTRIWEVSPDEIGGNYWKQLILCSFISLFLELLMIRWISSEVSIFAYFKNFVLIACFLGFGLGCYLSRRRINFLHLVVPLLGLTLLVKLPFQSLRIVVSAIPALVSAGSEVHVWEAPSQLSLPLLVIAAAIIVPIFSLICFTFIPFGQLVGYYLENARNGILAYSINVLASLAGILLYTLLSFLWQPPAVWFLIAGVLSVWLMWRVKNLRWATAAVFLACIVLLNVGGREEGTTYWSPYQKLTLVPEELDGQTVAYHVWTNDSWYQKMLNLSAEFVESHPQLFQKVPIEWNAYNLPYHFYRQPSSVLILGAGSGNDVAAALRNRSGSVTAVEIDPLILSLGEKLHFEKPYSSPRVRRVQNDARSYMQNTSDRFDLVVFSLLDSHTTSSNFTNIRIDNYVYTLEAMQAARRLLRPDGLLVVKFEVQTPWIAGRLHELLTTVFGRPPVQLQADSTVTTTPGRFYIAGSQERIEKALADPQLSNYVRQHGTFSMSSATLTTDDWPYFYQHEPGIPVAVIVISAALVILCWMLLRDAGISPKSLHWHFFFLGAGFLLLEAQIISRVALLFGTTWVVNSIVIGGLLLLVVGANFVVNFKPLFPSSIAYAGIFVTLVASYYLPLQKFLGATLWIKLLIASFVLCLPVFFAGIVFIRSFAMAGFRGEALGSNLFGAMIGGVLESASLLTGIRFLLVIAGALYLASWVALHLEVGLEQTSASKAKDSIASGVAV